MKTSGLLFFFVLILLIAGSCQKELYFPATDSVGTLKSDSTHDCFPSSVSGHYFVDSTLNNNNFIEVQVNVTVTGPYTIQSDTTNGYSFAATGNFDDKGLATVRLYASGKPTHAGLDQFIIRYGSSICVIDINVPASSEYEFMNCNAVVLSGTYQQGLAMDATNTATVSVNVTTAGSYNISAYEHGVTFYASGTFTNTGVQTIILNASGIPALGGISNYTLTGSTASCSFPVTFIPAAGQQAEYTFDIGLGSRCSQYVLSGSYMPGVAMNATNTLTLLVHVSTVGEYSISSNTFNGIAFIASGVFTTTGPATITLIASGTPLIAGGFDFQFSSATQGCNFIVEFGTDFLSASLDGNTVTTFNNNLSANLTITGGNSDLTITGSALATGNEKMRLELQLPGSISLNTQYTLNQAASNIYVTCTYTDPASVNWIAMSDISTQQSYPLTILIYELTTGPGGRVRGFFGGNNLNENGTGPATKGIAYGNFSMPLQ